MKSFKQRFLVAKMQNWNNIINLIKSNLGSKVSDIEITDDEFIEYIKDNTLPFFSQISPKVRWILLTPTHKVAIENTYSQWVYKIPVSENMTLIDIQSVYLGRGEFYNLYRNYLHNPADLVMNNTLSDMSKFLTTVTDYTFLKPDHIRFSQDPRQDNIIIEVNIEHNSLDTIPSDLYHKLFKQMCIVDGLELVLNNRNKFNNLSTPFGQIDLNIDSISSRIQDLRQKNEDIIENLPHREYLEIF